MISVENFLKFSGIRYQKFCRCGQSEAVVHEFIYVRDADEILGDSSADAAFIAAEKVGVPTGKRFWDAFLKMHISCVIVVDKAEQYRAFFSARQAPVSQMVVYYIPNTADPQKLYLSMKQFLRQEQKRIRMLVKTQYPGFVRLLAQGSSILEIEKYAHHLLGNPMIITDESYKVIGYTKDCDVSDPLWQSIVSNEYSSTDEVRRTDTNGFWSRLEYSPMPLFVDYEAFEGLARRAVAKIRIGSATKGYVALLEHDKHITTVDLYILQLVAEILSVKIKETNTVRMAKGQLCEEFVSDLLKGTMKNDRMIDNRAKALGIRFDQWSAVLCVEAENKEQYIREEMKKIKQQILRRNYLCIHTYSGSKAYYLVSFSDKNAWLAFLENVLESSMRECRLICGVSESVRQLTDIARCYDEVCRIASLLPSIAVADRHVYLYSYVAPYYMIRQLYTPENREQFSCKAYQTLLQTDAQEGTAYIPTLKSFFACNQNVPEAAKRLFVHRNTVNYRLEKIRELLDVDFDHPLIRLHLQMTIMAHDLLK